MTKMTKLEYYNRLKSAAFDGTFPSRDDDKCMYRKDTTSNCKQRCAVGLFIPDEIYHPNMEDLPFNWGIIPLTKLFPNIINFIPSGISINDISTLQGYHDELSLDWNPNLFMKCVDSMKCFKDCVGVN